MNALTKLLIVVAVIVIGTVGFAYSGIYDVSASSPHGGLTNWLLSKTSHASVERRARSVDVPELTDMSLVRAGINDFDSMCAACHGAPGKGPEAMGQGLNPPAPDLAESAAHLNSAELFWITKNGIKMTGMPAWGATHYDDALWPVVAFMTTLPDLDADGYQALLASATGMGHHTEADDSGGHEHDESNPGAAGVPDSHEHGETAAGPPTHDEPGDNHTHEADSHSYDEPAAEKEVVPHDDGHDHTH